MKIEVTKEMHAAMKRLEELNIITEETYLKIDPDRSNTVKQWQKCLCDQSAVFKEIGEMTVSAILEAAN